MAIIIKFKSFNSIFTYHKFSKSVWYLQRNRLTWQTFISMCPSFIRKLHHILLQSLFFYLLRCNFCCRLICGLDKFRIMYIVISLFDRNIFYSIIFNHFFTVFSTAVKLLSMNLNTSCSDVHQQPFRASNGMAIFFLVAF